MEEMKGRSDAFNLLYRLRGVTPGVSGGRLRQRTGSLDLSGMGNRKPGYFIQYLRPSIRTTPKDKRIEQT